MNSFINFLFFKHSFEIYFCKSTSLCTAGVTGSTLLLYKSTTRGIGNRLTNKNSRLTVTTVHCTGTFPKIRVLGMVQ